MDKMLFVWDFHGTLETGNVNAVQQIVNLVLAESGVNAKITINQAKQWYGLSWFDYFKSAVPDGGKQLWQRLTDKVMHLDERAWAIIRQHIKLRDFANEVLEEIKNQGHHNIVISNSKAESIQKFTQLLRISQYFEVSIGVVNHQNAFDPQPVHKAKGELLTDFLIGKRYSNIIMIGDAETDILVGKLHSATTYLISNNLTTDTKADYVTSDLRDVLKELLVPELL